MKKNTQIEDNNKYSDWLISEWGKQGGLIQSKVAADILQVSKTRIRQMREEGKLKEYKDPNGKIMLSFSEVMRIIEEKKMLYIINYDWIDTGSDKKGHEEINYQILKGKFNKNEIIYQLKDQVSKWCNSVEDCIEIKNLEIEKISIAEAKKRNVL